MSKQRTYWHLEKYRRKPSDYEVTTSRLLYCVRSELEDAPAVFEVQTPIADWHARHRPGVTLTCTDWERFSDPRRTTYATYVDLQRDREVYVDGLLASIANSGYDRQLDPEWIDVLDRVLAPLRFPIHGLQMVASYVGSLAPSGRITCCCAFQAADEIRRIQRIAYRMAQLRHTVESFGATSKASWQTHPSWQPLRRLTEQLLVEYDWSEAFVVLNLAVKPAFDRVFLFALGRGAHARQDGALQKILWSLYDDARWQQDWTRCLVGMLVEERTANASAIEATLERWVPRTLAALAPFEEFGIVTDVAGELAAYHDSMGLGSTANHGGDGS
jgi:toluene monooxygenase system protein E